MSAVPTAEERALRDRLLGWFMATMHEIERAGTVDNRTMPECTLEEGLRVLRLVADEVQEPRPGGQEYKSVPMTIDEGRFALAWIGARMATKCPDADGKLSGMHETKDEQVDVQVGYAVLHQDDAHEEWNAYGQEEPSAMRSSVARVAHVALVVLHVEGAPRMLLSPSEAQELAENVLQARYHALHEVRGLREGQS